MKLNLLQRLGQWLDPGPPEPRRVTPSTCLSTLRSLLLRGYTEYRGYTVCEKYEDGSVYIAVWLNPPEDKS